MMPKLIPMKERHPDNRCWFCRTDESVKYYATMASPQSRVNIKLINILVCSKCKKFHEYDFIPDEMIMEV